MPFNEVKPKKTFAYIAEQIIDAIRTREFKSGDLLPPERDLAQKFRVSRQAVREALAALQLAGVVETRAGAGTYIRSLPEDGLQRVWSLEQEESPLEVLEARLIVEPQVAALAAVRVSAVDLAHLHSLTEKMRLHLQNPQSFGEVDLAFHLQLARVCGNAVLYRFVEAVSGYVDQTLWRSLREKAYSSYQGLSEIYLGHHEKILQALEARDTEEAAAQMRTHLEYAQRVWFEGHE